MSGRRLYIGRLSQDAQRKDVEDYFGGLGPIVDIRIMAGFCFLEYEELKVRPRLPLPRLRGPAWGRRSRAGDARPNLPRRTA